MGIYKYFTFVEINTAFKHKILSIGFRYFFIAIKNFYQFISIRQITRLPKKVSPPDRGGES